MAIHDPEFLQKAAEARSRIIELNPAEVDALRLQGAFVVDVRNPSEFAEGHIEGALSVDFEHLHEQIKEQKPDLTTPIICYCNAGNRGALAADALQTLGYRNVFSIAGGLSAYRDALAT